MGPAFCGKISLNYQPMPHNNHREEDLNRGKALKSGLYLITYHKTEAWEMNGFNVSCIFT
jgi:hypothetical protein